jgi:peptide-methionine (R)-S-oxide reductase
MERRNFLGLAMGGIALGALGGYAQTTAEAPIAKVVKTDAEWKRLLSAEQYHVLRERGTERTFTSPLNDIHEPGTFVCAGCELTLFDAAKKFDSGTGWPSFWQPIAKSHVRELPDNSLGDTRTEVRCARCDGHLGHVFDDGPPPTGLRYCMNGVAMKFISAKTA